MRGRSRGDADDGAGCTEATIESLQDLYAVKHGLLDPDQVRRVTVSDALVDTGATLLSLPTSLIRQLGLSQFSSKAVLTSNGVIAKIPMYDAVRLTVQGRDCTIDVLEVPDGVPVLIGQIPLEHLDLFVDPVQRKLTGNPAHGGQHVYEMF
ncbi:MAG: aspartyl protease family protein [Isosphaeraceae bacterium]